MRLIPVLVLGLLVFPLVAAAGAGPRVESRRFVGKPPLASYCDETLAPETANVGGACFYMRGSHTVTLNATRESGLGGPGPVYAEWVVFGSQVVWASGHFCGEATITRGGLKLGVFVEDVAPPECGGLLQGADVGVVTATFLD